MEEIVQQFNSEQFGELRVVRDAEGEPWFVAKDVCEALELSNVGQAISTIDDDEKGSITINDGTPGNPNKAIVSEAGLYSLIFKSRKPEAKAFKRWVTHEVLPAIRRTGGYVAAGTDETPEQILARAVLVANDTIERQKRQIAGLTEDNARMLPKATMYDVAIEAEGTMTVTQAARYLGQIDKSVTQRRLFARLRADELLCKQSNAPTRHAIDRGLMVQVLSTRGDGKANAPYARVTRKGLDWCVEHYCAATRVAGVA